MSIEQLQEFEPLVHALIVGMVCVFCGVCIFQLFRHFRKEARDNKTVRENSAYYKNVLSLNASTQYIKITGNQIRHVLYANSKSKFDIFSRDQALGDVVTERSHEIESMLKAVQENRRVYEKYSAKLNGLHSVITEEKCRALNISFNKFVEIERKLVQNQRLNIVQSFSVVCNIVYTSPQGRNRYSKSYHFTENDITCFLKEKAEKERYRQTEEYRRKNERMKITSSLRYDVLKRDGFRCCKCGRSAQNGIELEVDHIKPISKGGTSDISNLQTLCRDCNRGKGAKY